MSDDQRTVQFDYSNYTPSRPEDLTPGTLLGKEKNYRLEKFLGAGGMGHAWLATEMEDGNELRKVVCKVLPALLQHEQNEMKKVVKTFRLVQPLSHPNICPIYALKADPVFGYFFVMGYADGGTFDDWIHDQPNYEEGLPVSQVLEVLRPVADALDHAHEMGVIHRDVKPQNILFATRAGRKTPWLIDFGISAQIHSTVTQTLCARGSSGTPAYMAPEQCQNMAQDGRTDQYAFGVMVYQCLTGHLPFTANNPVALWRAIVYNSAPPLSNVSPAVNKVVLRALSKERKDRFESCTEFMNELEAADKSDSKVSFVPSLMNAVRPAAEALKKHKWVCLACVLALLAVGFLVFGTSGKRPETAGPTLPTPAAEPEPDDEEVSILVADESDFEMDGSTIVKYTGHAAQVIIPAVINGQGVTKIGEEAFKDCDFLTQIRIPEGVVEIGREAFEQCISLQSVVIPFSVRSIDTSAFGDCASLTSVKIPQGVTSIQVYAFGNCPKLTIQAPAGSKAEEYAKSNKISFIVWNGESPQNTEVFSRKPTSRDSFDWDGTKIKKYIGKKTDVVIPEGTTAIGYMAFANNEYLTSVAIPETVKEIEDGAFMWCSSLTTVDIPEGLTKIGKKAFDGCSALTSITIPEGIKKIEKTSFMNCLGLTSVFIPDGVREIEDMAFNNCGSLLSVTIHKSVTKIGNGAFGRCPKLVIHAQAGSEAETYAKQRKIPVMPFVILQEDKSEPIPTNEDAAAAEPTSRDSFEWDGTKITKFIGKETDVVIPEGTTEIGMQVFLYRNITSVVIPKSVEKIGWNAFLGCSSLKSVVISEGVKEIYVCAFDGCSSLTSVVIPDSVEIIRAGAFARCPNLKEWSISSDHPHFKTDGIALLTKDGKTLVACLNPEGEYRIPEGVTKIEGLTFFGCRSLTSIVIPEGVTEFGSNVFWGCSALTEMTIPDSVQKIGAGAFRSCEALKEWPISPSNPYFKVDGNGLLTEDGKKLVACLASAREYRIPEGVTEIEDDVFMNCSFLESIVIPESVTKIGMQAFYGCTSLTSVVIPESTLFFGERVFGSCPNLTIIAPTGSKAEEYAKENNISFVDLSRPASRESFEWNGTRITKFIGNEPYVVIPEGVTEIGERAFQDCRSLMSVEIPEGVTVIGNWAFSLCSSLTSVNIPESVKELGKGVFEGCTALKEWPISSEHPYFKTDGPGLLTKDGKTLVACFPTANEYQVPEGVTVIGGSAFAYCGSLTTVVIPEGVTKIGDWVFYYCSSLTSVAISDSVKEIGIGAFAGCTALKEWTISSTHPYLKTDGVGLLTKDGKTLVACTGVAKEYRVPDGVTEIEGGTFNSCSSLTSVTIPDGVTKFGLNTFRGCSSLLSVTIPKSVTEIGNNSFFACPSLTIHAPAGSKVEEYAKENNIPFEALEEGKSEPKTTSRESFEWDGTKITKFVGKETDVVIPDGTTEIKGCAFDRCSSLKSVVIPDSVEKIGIAAFSHCPKLKKWSISSDHPYFKTDGVALLTKDGKTLVACLNPEGEYQIPESVTRIGGCVFYGCSSLTSVVIPEGVTEIGLSAFEGCSALTSVTIPDSVQEIRGGVFNYCKALKEWSISSAHPYFKSDGNGLLTKDGKKMIACLGSTKEYRIPEGVTVIGEDAFEGCTSLKSIVIPKGVKTIEWGGFYSCSSLTSVEIPDGVEEIGRDVFQYCSSLTSIVIPESVTEFGSNVFHACPNLTIHAPAGSKAEEYAQKNKIPFEAR